MNTAYWYKLQCNGGTADETSNKLRLTIPSGTGQACAGYVTKYDDTIDERLIEVDIPEFDSLDEMIIMIATSQTTGTDPYSLSNWYRCLKTKYTTGDYDWYVQKKVSGTATTLEQWDTSGGTGKLRIALDDGWIKFYEGDSLRYAEPYALGTTSVYVYIYASTLRSRNSGTDYMDDFAYTSYDSYYSKDDFTDTNYSNRWDWVSGSATIESGKFKMYSNGEQKTQAAYNDFRCVAGKVATTQSGAEHWQVAWLVAKYIDWDNQIYGLLWPDGTVELAVRYGGNQHGWATASGNVSNPMSEHSWEIVLTGNHAVILIDGMPKISATDNYFASIHSERLAVHGNSDDCIAKFDDIEVIDSGYYDPKTIGIWWVNDYHGRLGTLLYADDNTQDFSDQITQSSGWICLYNNGDDNAWESHWEKASVGGVDYAYADTVTIAYFYGHGWTDQFSFGTNHDGDSATNTTYAVKANESSWGENNLKWAIIDACHVIPPGSQSDWNTAFNGLQGICSFSSSTFDNDGLRQAFGYNLRVYNYNFTRAWYWATRNYEPQQVMACTYSAKIRIDANNYIYGRDDHLNNILPQYNSNDVIKTGYQYDQWECGGN